MFADDLITGKFSLLLAVLVLVFTLTLTFATPSQAQTFQTVQGLSFTMPFAGANPLP